MAEQHSLTEDYETPYKFNGKELDSETGLYYYGASYYDPRTSIWLSADPLIEEYPNVNPYVYCAQNPINMVDPDGIAPEPPINLFGKLDSAILHGVPKNFRYTVGDGKFSVFGHSHSGGIQYTDKKGNLQLATTAKEVNIILSERSPEWKKAMKEKREVTLTLYSCNAASEEYVAHDGRIIKRETTIAEKISEAYPWVTVVAADGYVVYGKDEKNNPVIEGVQNHKNDGGFIKIKDGEKLSKKQKAYIDNNTVIEKPKELLNDK